VERKGIGSGFLLSTGIEHHDLIIQQKLAFTDITSETDRKRSLSVYCCTFSRGWPVKAAYILSIF
jgi:hypothetical protein